jgi:signal transduction histidine kinase
MLREQQAFLMPVEQRAFLAAERRVVQDPHGSRATASLFHVLSRSLSMSTSQKQPYPLPATLAPREAWQRWLPLWYGIFYVMLVFSTLLSQREEAHTSGPFLAIFGLSVLLGIWYGICLSPFSAYVQRHLLLSTGYLLIGWGIWFGLTLLDSSYLFLLFGLYPQIFFFRPMPWKIIDAFILAVLSLGQQVLSLKSIETSMLLTLAAAGAGILNTLFIDAIIRRSRERQHLIRELEQARRALAVVERQAGVIEERQRLAHDIHDTLVQGFTSVVMQLEAAEEALPSNTSTLQRHLDQARRVARENLAEARRLLWALQPEAFDHASLPEVLTNLARNWSEENGVSASATITGVSRFLRPEIEVTLLRAAQETLANAGKYAQANQVMLTLSYMEDVVVLDVQDDGKGFDTAQLLASAAGHISSCFGLKGLRERVAQLGGTLFIESTPGEGTTIAVSLPAVSNESFLCPETAKEVSR